MISWPRSKPDYRWPDEFRGFRKTMRRYIAAGVFHFAYALGRMCSLLDRTAKRVLVIRTDGIGDALLFEPALESLARTMSPLVIHLWAPAPTCELLQLSPSLQRLRVIPRGFKPGNLRYYVDLDWRARMGYMLGRWTFERVMYLAQSPEPLGNWLFRSARARQRWLTDGDTLNQFEQQREKTQAKATRVIEARPGNAHELHRNEYIANQWTAGIKLRTPKLYFNESSKRLAEQRVDAWRTAARKLGGGEVVGVIVSGEQKVKSYDTAKWIVALRRIWEEQRAMPILLRSPDNAAGVEKLEQELLLGQVPFLKLERALSLPDIAATIAQLDGVLTIDTGLAHIAVAQNIATVVLATGGNPGRFFPWPDAPHHTTLTVAQACGGCNERCSQRRAECIQSVQPDQIVEAYARLKGRTSRPPVIIPPNVSPQRVAG